MMLMSDKFIPLDFLDQEEIELYRKTIKNINNTKNKNYLDYYELVLDNLLKKAIRTYKTKQKKELQKV